MGRTDCAVWHRVDDDPESEASRRLRLLRDRLRVALDEQPPGPIREHFEHSGFRTAPADLESAGDVHVGVERFVGTPEPLEPEHRLFSFRDPRRLTNKTLTRARRFVARSMRRPRD